MTSLWLLAGILYSEILDDLTGDLFWRDMYDQSVPLLLATGLFLYFMFSLIYTMVLALEKGRKAEQKALENQLWARSAELSSLKASIHPHFLFNSLNSLSTLTRKDPEMAHRISLQLADFLRYSLNYGKKEWVRVKDELEHIENFLEIEKTRLGNRMELAVSAAPDSLDEWLPPFTLLPLVENAVKHGFHASLDSGTLTLSIKRTGSNLIIEVENPFEKPLRASKGEGFGLLGLNQLLSAAYAGEAVLHTVQKNRMFRVRLQLPLGKGAGLSK
jgi:LytS/YehU family sensor histidine kinase